MNIKHLLVFFILFIQQEVFAQVLTVTNKENGQAIELVSIISQDPQAIATTNTKGKADISDFKGSKVILIHMYGYESLNLSFDSLKQLEFQVALGIDDFNMDEVVVSATRWRQLAKDIPSKISSISPQEVSLQNPQTAADLLGISGQVFIQKSQQGGGSPMIRGFATNRLLYVVDGVRMNNAIFRGGNIQNVINLDPFAIDDTEIVFGPGSVIYGSDAIGGIMSFQTIRPQLSLKDSLSISGKAIVRYSTANQERTAHAHINLGWGKWASITSLSSWQYDHLKQGRYGPKDYIKSYYVQRIDSTDQLIEQEDQLLQIPTAYDQLNIMQKLRYRPNKNWDFTYGFHASETSPYGRYDRHNRIRNDLPRYATWNYGPQKWQMHHLQVMHINKTALYDEMSLRLAHQQFEESRISRNFNDPIETTQEEAVKTYSFNMDLSKSINDEHRIYYGTEYVLNEVNSQAGTININTQTSSDAASRYPQSLWSSFGAYLNDEWKINSKLTSQLGVRYSIYQIEADFNSDFFNLPFNSAKLNEGALTASGGLVYRPTKQWIIKMNAGTAFRAPNVDDIGKIFDSEPGAVTIPNPDLRAEYAYNLDLSLSKVVNSFMKIDITGYYTYLDNAITRRNSQLNGQDSIIYEGVLSQVQSLQNASFAKVVGLQASMEMKFSKSLNWASDINWQKGEEELENGSISSSRHTAPLFGRSRLIFRAKKLHLQGYVQFQGEQSASELSVEESGKDEIYAKDANGNNFAPAWYTLNLKANYQFNQTFTFSVGVENITDQRYRPYSSGVSGAGRNFLISLDLNL